MYKRQNDGGDHGEKREGGCQNSTTCSVEHSSVGSKTDGAEPSVAFWVAVSVLFSEMTGPLVHERTSPMDPDLVAPSLIGENGYMMLLLRPMVSVVDQRGQGALSPFCLTRAAFIRI